MMRAQVIAAALFALACQEPGSASEPAPPDTPEPPREEAVPEPEPEREPLTDESGRRFPFEVFRGNWRCDVVWLQHGLPLAAYREGAQRQPSAGRYDEGERSDAVVSIEQNTHAPSHVTVVVEGCPFFVSSIRRSPNPDSWSIGPNRCGETRYSDGFIILTQWTDRFEGTSIDGHPYEYAVHHRELVVQISGVRDEPGGDTYHVTNSYACYDLVPEPDE